MEKLMHSVARQQSKTYRVTWETLELWLLPTGTCSEEGFAVYFEGISVTRCSLKCFSGREKVARVHLPLIPCITEVAEWIKKKTNPLTLQTSSYQILDANGFQGEWWILISFTTIPNTAISQRIAGNPLYKQVILNQLHSANVPLHVPKDFNSLYMSLNARAYQSLARLNILPSSNWMFFLVKYSGQHFLMTVTHFLMVPIYPHGDLTLENKC